MPKMTANTEFLANHVAYDDNSYIATKTFNQVYIEVVSSTKGKNLTIKHLIESSNGKVFRKSGALFGVRLITVMEKTLMQKVADLESQIEKLKPVQSTPLVIPVVEKKELTIEEQEAFDQWEMGRQQEELNLMELEDTRSMDEYIKFKAQEEMDFNESRPMSDEMYEYTAESLIVPSEEERILLERLENVLIQKYKNGLSAEQRSEIKKEYFEIKKSLREHYEILDIRAQPILKMFCCDNYAKASTELVVRQSMDLYLGDDGRVDHALKAQFWEETYSKIRAGIYKARLEKITDEIREYVINKYYRQN